jgi:hypothetical protein
MIGIKVGGRSGYLVYLRSNGSVELFRAGTIVGGINKIIVDDAKVSWTHIRIDTIDATVKVYVNKKLHISTSDKTFGERGYILLTGKDWTYQD